MNYEYQPPAATVLNWLHSNLGAAAVAPLTGCDARSLRAAVQIMEAYAYDRDPSLLTAFKIVVQRMQRKTQELAYHAIAHPLDWSDRAKVWAGAGLPSFSAAQPWPGARMKCSFEPGGCLVDYMEIEAEQARKEVA